MKAVVLIVGVLTGAMFFTSLIVTTRLTGTLNPAETVKLIGEPYEESSDFSNTVESYMLQVLEQFQLKTLFESDGAYNPDKVIDVMSYFGASGADAENHSGLVYRLSDLIEWSKAYSVESGGVYDKNAVIVLPLLLLSAVALPLAALPPYGCGTPLAGAALPIL